jgi:competence protein ComGC
METVREKLKFEKDSQRTTLYNMMVVLLIIAVY